MSDDEEREKIVLDAMGDPFTVAGDVIRLRARLAEAERDLARYREALEYAKDYSNDPGVVAEAKCVLAGTKEGT